MTERTPRCGRWSNGTSRSAPRSRRRTPRASSRRRSTNASPCSAAAARASRNPRTAAGMSTNGCARPYSCISAPTTTHVIEAGALRFFDKLPLKYGAYDAARFRADGTRVVPGAIVRAGAHVARDAVLMPCFVNVGAWIGPGTMVDTWATVGSCAQIGRNVHLSGGVGIGGVLEPLQAQPTIIEDDCFIGARSEVVEGVIVERGAVLSMGVFIGASTRIYDRETGESLVRPRAGRVGRGAGQPPCGGRHAFPLLRRHRQEGRRTDARKDVDQRAPAHVARSEMLHGDAGLHGPIVIGGVGGSGMRVLAKSSRCSGLSGADLNKASDNLTYTLLFRRPRWFYRHRHDASHRRGHRLSASSERTRHFRTGVPLSDGPSFPWRRSAHVATTGEKPGQGTGKGCGQLKLQRLRLSNRESLPGSATGDGRNPIAPADREPGRTISRLQGPVASSF